MTSSPARPTRRRGSSSTTPAPTTRRWRSPSRGSTAPSWPTCRWASSATSAVHLRRPRPRAGRGGRRRAEVTDADIDDLLAGSDTWTVERDLPAETPPGEPGRRRERRARSARHGLRPRGLRDLGALPALLRRPRAAGAWEILAHRILWTLLFCVVLLARPRDIAWIRPFCDGRARGGHRRRRRPHRGQLGPLRHRGDVGQHESRRPSATSSTRSSPSPSASSCSASSCGRSSGSRSASALVGRDLPGRDGRSHPRGSR